MSSINEKISKIINNNKYSKPKRPLTIYNLFFKQKMEELKENGMNSNEKMKRIVEMWKEYKESKESKLSNDDKKDINNKDDNNIYWY